MWLFLPSPEYIKIYTCTCTFEGFSLPHIPSSTTNGGRLVYSEPDRLQPSCCLHVLDLLFRPMTDCPVAIVFADQAKNSSGELRCSPILLKVLVRSIFAVAGCWCSSRKKKGARPSPFKSALFHRPPTHCVLLRTWNSCSYILKTQTFTFKTWGPFQNGHLTWNSMFHTGNCLVFLSIYNNALVDLGDFV